MDKFSRRNFLGAGLLLGASSLFAKETTKAIVNKNPEFIPPVVAFPEKKPMKTISDRPPLLASNRGRELFTEAITPNDQFFVRWHLPDMPMYVDLNKFVLK